MWWLVNAERLQRERQAIDELSADWFQQPEWSIDNKTRLLLKFAICLPRGVFQLQLIYHQTFPASPPSVRPQSGDERLSSHQYGGEDLCLEIRNDNWHPEFTGADLITSAKRLLEQEAPDEQGVSTPAPSADDLPESIRLRNKYCRFYLDPISRIILSQDLLDQSNFCCVAGDQNGANYMIYLTSVGDAPSEILTFSTPQLKKSLNELTGVAIGTDFTTDEIKKIQTFSELEEKIGPTVGCELLQSRALLIRSKSKDFVFFYHIQNDEKLYKFETVLAPFETSRSGLQVSELTERRVGIVGLGSVGSKVALSLARSGIRKFTLVDSDILHIGNLERYDGDWRDVGQHKVDIAEHRLKLIHRSCEAEVFRSAIGAQVSSQEAANINNALSKCDVIVDATSNADVFNQLAMLSIQSSISLIWGAVFAGGIGGEIARARVNKDPSPFDIRKALFSAYQNSDEAPPIATGRGYDGSVDQQEIMVATDADVSIIAANMANMVVDTVNNTEPTAFDAHAYLLGFKRQWLFSGVFDTHPINADAPIRGTLSLPDPEQVDSKFVLSLLKKKTDDDEN